MNKLSINNGSFNLDEIDLDHGTVTIGRATDNDIRLDDSAVSSHHAKIVTFFNVSYIEDLDSTNGTIVNGRVIKKYTLHTGDIVLLGKHQLLFQGSAAVEASGKGDATIVMSQADVKNAMAATPESAEQAKPASIMPAPVIPAAMPTPAPAPISTPTPAPAAMTMAENANGGDILAPERAPERIPTPTTPAPAVVAVTAKAATPVPPMSKPITPTPPPPVAQKPAPVTERPMRTVMENITAAPSTPDRESMASTSLDSLEQHNEAFSLLNDDADLDIKIGADQFTAFDKDESLLIPAFIKSDKTSVSKPAIKTPPVAKAAAPKPVPPQRRQNPAQATPPAAKANRPVEAKAPIRKKPVRKVLEDPSASFGNPIEHSAPMGINEVDRVNQYREKSDATNPGVGMPAVGDRTLLKQIITGDGSFTSSKNKFEIIQIVLGFVIFSIIALIAFASF